MLPNEKLFSVNLAKLHLKKIVRRSKETVLPHPWVQNGPLPGATRSITPSPWFSLMSMNYCLTLKCIIYTFGMLVIYQANLIVRFNWELTYIIYTLQSIHNIILVW